MPDRTIKIKNWSSYQSYKDRKPTWIRLHKGLLDDYEFQMMNVNARAMLPMLWLLASEDKDPLSGLIKKSSNEIGFRLHQPPKVIDKSLQELESCGFIIITTEGNIPKEIHGLVYFLFNKENNNVKIGFSSRIEFRKKEIERQEKCDLDLLLCIPGTKKDESELHERFKEHRINKTEWFQYVTSIKNFCNDSVTEKHNSVTTEKRREEKRRGEEIKSDQRRLSPLSDLWNKTCVNLPKVIDATDGRRDKERIRIKKRPLDQWGLIFRMINGSEFCRGNNQRKWVASYDWIINNDENAVKVLEGKYDDRKPFGRKEKDY